MNTRQSGTNTRSPDVEIRPKLVVAGVSEIRKELFPSMEPFVIRLDRMVSMIGPSSCRMEPGWSYPSMSGISDPDGGGGGVRRALYVGNP